MWSSGRSTSFAMQSKESQVGPHKVDKCFSSCAEWFCNQDRASEPCITHQRTRTHTDFHAFNKVFASCTRTLAYYMYTSVTKERSRPFHLSPEDFGFLPHKVYCREIRDKRTLSPSGAVKGRAHPLVFPSPRIIRLSASERPGFRLSEASIV